MPKVVLTGHLVDRAGWREREMSAHTLSELVETLADSNPELGAGLAGRGIRAVINQAIVHGDTPLQASDEVAFLPIYSGG